jgi:hypothetical protein
MNFDVRPSFHHRGFVPSRLSDAGRHSPWHRPDAGGIQNPLQLTPKQRKGGPRPALFVSTSKRVFTTHTGGAPSRRTSKKQLPRVSSRLKRREHRNV